MITRRKLVVGLGAAALVSPLRSLSQQQGKVWRVGFLALRRIGPLDTDYFGAFPRGMRDLGYIEGKHLTIEWRSADGKAERLPELAAELVQLKVDVMVAGGLSAGRAAQKATTTIPIVTVTGDPVGSGLVKSMARPGGNTTGFANLQGDLGAKHLEMLLILLPKLSRVAVIVTSAQEATSKNVQAVAQRASVKVLTVDARTAQEMDSAFSMMAQQNVQAVIFPRAPLITQQHRQIAELATKYRLPSIAGIREYADAGGLMSYGSSPTHEYSRVASYVDKIFKGAKPGDLPIEQPSKFEMFINRKTAKALGLTIPQEILLRADKVIE